MGGNGAGIAFDATASESLLATLTDDSERRMCTIFATQDCYIKQTTPANAMSIYHDGSASATAATVEVKDATLVLIITGGANAGTNTYTFAGASHDTIGEIVTAINALSEGWVAVLLGTGSDNSEGLVVAAVTSALLAANTQTIEIIDIVTTSNGAFLKANTYVPILVEKGAEYLSVIRVSADGTWYRWDHQ